MVGDVNVGQNLTLTRKIAKALASAAIVGSLTLGVWVLAEKPSIAGGETRTISLYHQHTKESLTVTYMVNGRYVPSAMKKLNRFFRDWRRNEVTTIDPRTIDVVWEMHADLGSKRPIHIVSGYRSPKTNAFLKRIGRKVAKKSQHMKGKAIDFFFPDVPTAKIRDSAVARRVGGVGYYRSSGGPTGFIHADSGNVRTWGPGMKGSQLADHMRKGKATIGKRFGKKNWSDTQVASASGGDDESKSGGLWNLITGKRNKAEAPVVAAAAPVEEPLESAYENDGDELANLSADAAAAEATAAKKAKRKLQPPTLVEEDHGDDGDEGEPYGLTAEAPAPKKKPVSGVANGELAALADSASVEPAYAPAEPAMAQSKAANVPKPKLKPPVVLALAEAKADAVLPDDTRIEPASAPPESQTAKIAKKPSQIAAATLGSFGSSDDDVIDGPLEQASVLPSDETDSNADGKSSLDGELRIGGDEDSVIVQPVIAALEGKNNEEPSWWSFLYADAEKTLRREGLSPSMEELKTDVMPVAVDLGPDGTGPATGLAAVPTLAEDDGELVVNREGKGNLPDLKLRFSQNGQ